MIKYFCFFLTYDETLSEVLFLNALLAYYFFLEVKQASFFKARVRFKREAKMSPIL